MESEGFEDGEWMEAVAGRGGGKGERKKRFSEEQIKSLESMFATQTKLEPRQKLQLARELGLQPRQVAIWFQNKRARWKSKQLEKEYSSLRDDYEALLCSFDSLKKEKQALLKQLEKLAEMLQEPRGKYGNAGAGDGRGDVRSGGAAREESGPAAVFYSADSGNRFLQFGDEETGGVFRPLQPAAHAATADSFATAGEHQFQFHSSWPSSEQTCSGSQWWEFESLSE